MSSINHSSMSSQPQPYSPRTSESAVDQDDFAQFQSVVNRINFDSIQSIARLARQEAEPGIVADALLCRVNMSGRMAGSFNILYPIEFSDGVRWLIKIPINGGPKNFSLEAAKSLIAQARIMQLLRAKTTIPVPQVFAFDATCTNEVNVPYMLLQFVRGIPLDRVWSNFDMPRADLVGRNSKILSQLATAMIQLNNFTFSTGGTPQFDDAGTLLSTVGPVWEHDLTGGLNSIMAKVEDKNNDDDEEQYYCGHGPFNSVAEFFFSFLPPSDDSWEALLQVLIRWAPDGEFANGHHFALGHPDLNLQNIFVDAESGNLVSIIDWDGVQAFPRCLAGEKLPLWLTRDMDGNAGRTFVPVEALNPHESISERREKFRPLSQEELEMPVKLQMDKPGRFVLDESPEELREYRKVWAATIAEHVMHAEQKKKALEAVGASRVFEVARLATRSHSMLPSIVSRIFDELAKYDIMPGDSPSTQDTECKETNVEDVETHFKANDAISIEEHHTYEADSVPPKIKVVLNQTWTRVKNWGGKLLSQLSQLWQLLHTAVCQIHAAYDEALLQDGENDEMHMDSSVVKESETGSESASEIEEECAESETSDVEPFSLYMFLWPIEDGPLDTELTERLKKAYERAAGDI